MKVLKVEQLRANALLPVRQSPGSAGLDIFACLETCIPAHKWATVSTGIAVEIPPGYYGRIAPRSGLALNFGLDVLAGVVDSDYRGEVICVLINHGEEDYHVKVGQRIAQLIIETSSIVNPVFSTTSSSERGEKGFGSSGD